MSSNVRNSFEKNAYRLDMDLVHVKVVEYWLKIQFDFTASARNLGHRAGEAALSGGLH